ncbi:MAG: hypothetical protein IJK41_07485 [Muribaculaceae bacterium]|nr:hypothetical protein [Muribaculaceae bacterium]
MCIKTENCYFSRKGNSLHLFVYDSDSRKTCSKSVNVLFGKHKLINSAKDFDDKKRYFPNKLKNAEKDNATLNQWLNVVSVILDAGIITSAKDLLNVLQQENKSPMLAQGRKITLLEHAKAVYQYNEQRQSSNKFIYSKFINKLAKQQATAKAGEIVFADLPISEITSTTFKNWENCVVSHNWGYRDSMNAFRHVVYDYHKKVLGNDSFRLNVTIKTQKAKIKCNGIKETLTPQQLQQLEAFNVATITSGKNTANYQMLLDYALFMYYTFSRPYDVLLCDVSDIKHEKTFSNTLCWEYAPHKKGENATSILIPIIGDKALTIIDKYKGSRSSGYLFPFLNDTKGSEYNKRNKIEMQCNGLLQRIAQLNGWDIRPTLYTLRHTAITSAIANGWDVSDVASFAQTSVREIESTYLDKKTLAVRAYNRIKQAI